MAHTLTSVVHPVFCMVLNILTQYPLYAPQAQKLDFLTTYKDEIVGLKGNAGIVSDVVKQCVVRAQVGGKA